tara:strand:+ start:15938 stop:17194 length:1257 start_codon:yes stop_codon:yes gene_type:complete
MSHHLFENNVLKKLNTYKDKKILVCMSGGLDSTVLAHLMLNNNFKISVAHVNYSLRGNESLKNEKFVRNFCKSHKLKLHLKKLSQGELNKSIQLEARNIRYDWFKKVLNENDYHLITTAHHLDDNIENILIGMFRNPSKNSLTLIPEKNQNIMRPFLNERKDYIIAYARNNGIEFSVDSSNSQNYFLRNRIRNILIPEIEKIDKNFTNKVSEIIDSINISKNGFVIDNLFIQKPDYIQVKKQDLQNEKSLKYFIENLKNFNFYSTKEILNFLTAKTGKKIVSNTHTILSNRSFFLIKRNESRDYKEYELDLGVNHNPFIIKLERSDRAKEPNSREICLFSDIKLPLTIRRPKEGDIFYPHGMKGKKKLSKFFKDKKMSIFAKQNQWVVSTGDNILWIIGQRADNRFIKTKGKCLKISI